MPASSRSCAAPSRSASRRLEQGNYVEVDDADLDAYLDSLAVEDLAEPRGQVRRGELATDEEIEAAYARFR